MFIYGVCSSWLGQCVVVRVVEEVSYLVLDVAIQAIPSC